MANKLLNAAIKYAQEGFPVFPCKGKTPACPHGFKDATSDEEKLKKLWNDKPYNIGLATGGGFVVLDVDHHNGGADGLETLARLQQEHGELPETWTVRTGTGGLHYYFLCDDEKLTIASAFQPGLDYRGNGGYVIVPPSIHPETGKPYNWVEGKNPSKMTVMAQLPEWLHRLMLEGRKGNTSKNPEQTTVEEQPYRQEAPDMITEGTRNDELYRLACSLRAKGLTERGILAAIQEENQSRCNPPLPDKEIRQICKQAAKYPAGNQQKEVPPKEPAKPRKLKRAADFGEDNTSFLWYPYLPIGDYSVMMAEGGTGKTILCCGIAAAISAGKPLPGEEFSAAGQNVLIISAEDSGEILKRRLQLSGADLKQVFILDRSDSIGMNFSSGYGDFEATVKEANPRLVIIDPWHGFLGESVDINRVNAIRPVFQRVANLAKICDCAIILVSHVNKRSQGENANNAATGSSDFINASRSAFRVIFDETDEDCRIMVHTKTNYASYGKSPKYRIVDGGLQWEGFSAITRQTLEKAARQRSTPFELMQETEEKNAASNALVEALEASADQYKPTRFSYDEFKREHGEMIFGGLQPKRALDAVKERLSEEGFFLRTDLQIKKAGTKGRGFLIQRIETSTGEQVQFRA